MGEKTTEMRRGVETMKELRRGEKIKYATRR